MESLGGSSSTAILVEVRAHRRREPAGGLIVVSEAPKFTAHKHARLLDSHRGDGAQSDGVVAGHAAGGATGQHGDSLRFERFAIAGAKTRDAARGFADRNPDAGRIGCSKSQLVQ